MFLRISEYVESGSLDNTTQGEIVLVLKFVEVKRPITLNIKGNCLRDIAGSKIEFVNMGSKRAMPDSMLIARLKMSLPSLACDMTVSKQGWDEKTGESNNWLSLSWVFADEAIFLLESAHYDVTMTPHQWVMNRDEEFGVIAHNQANLRHGLQTWIQGVAQALQDEGLPDYYWDTRLREAELLASAYQELCYKYRFDDFPQLDIAYLLGWDARLQRVIDTGSLRSAKFPKTNILSIFDILSKEEGDAVRAQMDHPLFKAITTLTEEAQEEFEKDIKLYENAENVPQDHIATLFDAIRFLTPRCLSILLHTAEKKPDTHTIISRAQLCINCIDQAYCEITVQDSIPPMQMLAVEKLLNILLQIKDALNNVKAKLVKKFGQ